ncbi:hypothetical protein Q3G72_004579 [Acer saccharum]|nr:hypothetical protein Q3G72_004579 [Acer saccharum]
MGSEFRNSNGKSEIIKGKGDSIGNEGFELLSLAEFSERRWLLKIRAWSVVLELISKKGMSNQLNLNRGEEDDLQSKTKLTTSLTKLNQLDEIDDLQSKTKLKIRTSNRTKPASDLNKTRPRFEEEARA